MMLVSFSVILAVFFFGLTASAGEAADNSITCPNGRRSVQTWLSLQNRRQRRSYWNDYLTSTIRNVCVRSQHEHPPGLLCECINDRIQCGTRPSNRDRGWWAQALTMCFTECRCRGDTRPMNSQLTDATQAPRKEDPFWGEMEDQQDDLSQSGTSSQASKDWTLQSIWGKTKKICGWKSCSGPGSCNSLRGIDGCDRLVCRVWEPTPFGIKDSSACYIPHSSGMFNSFSALGGRSVDQAACACNASYISHQCCEEPDGIVWEAPEAKLGELNSELKI